MIVQDVIIVKKWTFKRLQRESVNKPNIDFSKVTEEHITRGVYSQLPISCFRCLHEWTTDIFQLFHSTFDCPVCDSYLWTFEKFQVEKLKITGFNFNKVTKDHLVNGANSMLPITCVECDYGYDKELSSIFASKLSGCPRCTDNEPWSLEKLNMKKHERPDFNFDAVVEEDIQDGGLSLIPIKCVVCKDEFERTIHNIFLVLVYVQNVTQIKAQKPLYLTWIIKKLNVNLKRHSLF